MTAPALAVDDWRHVRRGSKEHARVRANTTAAMYYRDRRTPGEPANLAEMWKSFDMLRYCRCNMYADADGRYRLDFGLSVFYLTVAD
ncbi:hypothetical protein [Nocardia sp. NPDC049707]|uniref:hypothetical protein n=1 Tax=Nocardia sp. NPDC049707 TaxID=3154735 RepID=UPI0034383576